MIREGPQRKRADGLFWSYRELWAHGLIWAALAGSATARAAWPPLQIAVSVLGGTLLGTYIGYLFHSFRRGKEGR